MTTPFFRLALFMLGFALWILPATVRAASIVDALPPTANALETREFHMQNARLPGPPPVSAHQNVTAWQVAQGSWNGQSLDGLSLIFVQSTADAGIPARLTNCYVSQEANPAQRAALVDAFLASSTQSITPFDVNMMRLEPAVITIEIDGQSVVLHLGLLG